MKENLNIYYRNYEKKGRMDRNQVHFSGEWHETFQCIFTKQDSLFLQKRSSSVNDYKEKLDITVGGHLLYNETVKDGLREIKEEMGVDIDHNRLAFLCTLPEIMISENIIDKEFIHVYTYEITDEEYQRIEFDDEVEDLIRVDIEDFNKFCLNENEELVGMSKKTKNEFLLKKQDFIPYSDAYFICIGSLINNAHGK